MDSREPGHRLPRDRDVSMREPPAGPDAWDRHSAAASCGMLRCPFAARLRRPRGAGGMCLQTVRNVLAAAPSRPTMRFVASGRDDRRMGESAHQTASDPVFFFLICRCQVPGQSPEPSRTLGFEIDSAGSINDGQRPRSAGLCQCNKALSTAQPCHVSTRRIAASYI